VGSGSHLKKSNKYYRNLKDGNKDRKSEECTMLASKRRKKGCTWRAIVRGMGYMLQLMKMKRLTTCLPQS